MWPPDDYRDRNRGLPEHPEEALAAFALNALDDAEFQAVFHHVVRCLHCQEVLLGFQETAARLTSAAPDTPLPPDLKSRTLSAALGRRTESPEPDPAAAACRAPRWSSGPPFPGSRAKLPGSAGSGQRGERRPETRRRPAR